jgi:hypothetical protein
MLFWHGAGVHNCLPLSPGTSRIMYGVSYRAITRATVYS